jgi:hypothetical protein
VPTIGAEFDTSARRQSAIMIAAFFIVSFIFVDFIELKGGREIATCRMRHIDPRSSVEDSRV